jgi:hypothetical protein
MPDTPSSPPAIGAGPAIVDADALDDETIDTGVGAEWETWDVSRPLEGDCELKLHKWDEPAGKVRWSLVLGCGIDFRMEGGCELNVYKWDEPAGKVPLALVFSHYRRNARARVCAHICPANIPTGPLSRFVPLPSGSLLAFESPSPVFRSPPPTHFNLSPPILFLPLRKSSGTPARTSWARHSNRSTRRR